MSSFWMQLPEEDRGTYSHGDVWHALLALLLPGHEPKCRARTTGALRRHRGVREASDLLRVALSYGFCGLSLSGTSAWAKANGSGKLCKSAVLRRIGNCGDWLESLIADRLSARLPAPVAAGLRIQLVDATRISPPGCKGRSWRVHVAYCPMSRKLLQVQITDHKGGERLDRFKAKPGDLVIGDRAYGSGPGVTKLARAGADFLVRSTWHHLPQRLEEEDGTPFDLFRALRTVKTKQTGDFACQLTLDDQSTIPCRVVAVRKPDEAAQAAKKRILADAKKKGTRVDPRTLEACHYFFVVTSLSAERFSAAQVLEFYRLRWQVEVEFKRLKTVLSLDDLRAKKPKTARAALAAKLLGALAVEDLVAQFPAEQHHWTLTSIIRDAVKQAILGSTAALKWIAGEPQTACPVNDSRRRVPQCEALQAVLA